MEIILSVITTLMTGGIGLLFHKFKAREEERERLEQKRLEEVLRREAAINKALRALCRDRILQGYKHYKQSGGITPQDLETMTKLYYAYHALGEGGTITAVYENILQLPLKEGD